MLAQVHTRTELLDKAIHNCLFDVRRVPHLRRVFLRLRWAFALSANRLHY
jgi:hypothetical protein